MKVLIYAIDFPPKIGGEETYLLLLGRGLADRLCQVNKEIRPWRGEDTRTKRGNWNVIVVTRTAADGFDDSMLPFPVVRRPGLVRLWRLLGEADVVQLSGPVLLPLLLGLLRRKPIVIAHHVYHSMCPNGFLLYEPTKTACPGHFLARRYHECLRCNAVSLGWQKSLLVLLATFPRHWMCKRASANIGITDHVSERIALPRTKTIYYGIPDLLAHSLDSFHHPSTASTFCFAYVGRLVKEKGLFLLLEAAKRLKDEEYEFRLKFIGNGLERVHLEAKVAALSLQEQVQFNGFLQGEALEAALADVAIVVMPSICEETAGLAAIEHMMRGRLVIAADIAGLGEVVGNAGLKFSPGDVDGLTARLRQVLDKPTLVVEVGRKARERALQYFRQERMVAEHYRLYEKLVKG